jgi:hypothetical protein
MSNELNNPLMSMTWFASTACLLEGYLLDLEVAIVEGYPIEGGFVIDFFLCIFTYET